MDLYQEHIEADYLAQCSPQSAYDWLYEHSYKDEERLNIFSEGSGIREETVLSQREDALIDLGIARYGRSLQIIREVFLRGNIGVRCAALSNPHIGPSYGVFGKGWLQKTDIKDIILKGAGIKLEWDEFGKANVELEAIAKNRFLVDESLKNLIRREEEFAELTDDQYLMTLVWLGENPRMSAQFDDNTLDGWARVQFGQVASLAWELARNLPATNDNASVLGGLLEHTALPVGYDKPEEVLERWRIGEDKENDEPTYSSRYLLRSRIADVIEANEELLDSRDPAVRESFYRRFSPWKFKEWPSFIERDGERAVQSMFRNDNLWQTEETRDKLKECAWNAPDPHSSMSAPQIYIYSEERIRRRHPEWFSDEYLETSDETDAIVKRLETKVDKIVNDLEESPSNDSQVTLEVKDAIDRIEKLLDQVEEIRTQDQNELSQDIDKLRIELSELRTMQIESSPEQPSTPIWPWMITILLLLLILIRQLTF